MYTTLISPEILTQHVHDPNWIIFDCRFVLADPDQGRRAYEQSHLPSARYADLNRDLSGPILSRPGGFTETGRHPLPDVDTFVATLNRWGVTNKTQVIAYDDKDGGLAAARLWWMLRWVGHDAVAVLDGGWQGWVRKAYPVSSEPWTENSDKPAGKPFHARVRAEMVVGAEEVYKAREEFSPLFILDSRVPERYRGETEPIDPIAGRIPWARNAPYAETQSPEGFFRSQKELKSHFQNLLGELKGNHAAFYCGSGVTAAANLLALKHAGLGDGKLYAGSWSEWIADPARPIAFTQTYLPPLDQLLTLGEDPAREYPWPDYSAYGLTNQHIPDLIRMATDWDLYWALPDEPRVFAPIHAWRALGQLRAEAAIEPLLILFHVLEDIDWANEEFPEVYGMIGPVAIPALTSYLRDASHSLYPRVTAMTALEKIGNEYPTARAQCVEILTQQLEQFAQQDEVFNGFLVSSLVALKAVEAAPTIERAFAAERVDEGIQGDWEDIQIELGLLAERKTEPFKLNPWMDPTLLRTPSPRSERLDEFTIFPFAKKQDPRKVKAKRKQEKQSRKANRKKQKKK